MWWCSSSSSSSSSSSTTRSSRIDFGGRCRCCLFTLTLAFHLTTLATTVAALPTVSYAAAGRRHGHVGTRLWGLGVGWGGRSRKRRKRGGWMGKGKAWVWPRRLLALSCRDWERKERHVGRGQGASRSLQEEGKGNGRGLGLDVPCCASTVSVGKTGRASPSTGGERCERCPPSSHSL